MVGERLRLPSGLDHLLRPGGDSRGPHLHDRHPRVPAWGNPDCRLQRVRAGGGVLAAPRSLLATCGLDYCCYRAQYLCTGRLREGFPGSASGFEYGLLCVHRNRRGPFRPRNSQSRHHDSCGGLLGASGHLRGTWRTRQTPGPFSLQFLRLAPIRYFLCPLGSIDPWFGQRAGGDHCRSSGTPALPEAAEDGGPRHPNHGGHLSKSGILNSVDQPPSYRQRAEWWRRCMIFA
mmetsp:Transcript_7994/g.14542  ORF Transcript_7994/g.14542 Transcript_7994/m.14542 type:complete len:232 (+) Transcript_7994:386-1081(+)